MSDSKAVVTHHVPERWITVVVMREGKRKAFRYPLNIPLALARGHLERLSDRALKDLASDLGHEIRRRREELFET